MRLCEPNGSRRPETSDPPAPAAVKSAGADDYVTKPFGMAELTARLRAAVRRTDDTPLAPETTLVDTDEFVIHLRAK